MLSALLGLAQDTSTAPDFEAAVLTLLQHSVGFDVGYFSVRGREASPTVVGFDDALVTRAVRGGPRYHAELMPVKQAALRARGVAVDSDVLGEAGVRRAAYHRHLMRSIGGRHALFAYLPLRGDVFGSILLGRCGSTFSDAQRRDIEAMLSELGVARASFGLPGTSEPLATPAQARLRLPWGERSTVLAVERIGDTRVEVRDRDGFREMVAREHGTELVWTRASISDPSESGWPYVELLHIAAVQARARNRALFIGCGGAVALRQFANVYPGLAIDVVEREAVVVELARAWYALDRIPRLSVFVEDGARFVAAAPASRWDIAVIDAFDASDATIALRQRPFFEALERALAPGGALAINLIGNLDGHGTVREVTSWLARSFARVRVVPVMEAGERYSPDMPRNVVLIASKRGQ